jgi:hypothetical protein
MACLVTLAIINKARSTLIIAPVIDVSVEFLTEFGKQQPKA